MVKIIWNTLLWPYTSRSQYCMKVLLISLAFLQNANVPLTELVFIHFVIWNVLVCKPIVPFLSQHLISIKVNNDYSLLLML
jgi:hypothetical protein